MKELRKKLDELEQIIRRAFPEVKAESGNGEAKTEKGEDAVKEGKLVDHE
jgi:hypothetical protein